MLARKEALATGHHIRLHNIYIRQTRTDQTGGFGQKIWFAWSLALAETMLEHQLYYCRTGCARVAATMVGQQLGCSMTLPMKSLLFLKLQQQDEKNTNS